MTTTWSTQEIQELLELKGPSPSEETLTPEPDSEEGSPNSSPSENRKRLSKSPYARLGIIALTCGLGAGLLGLLFSQGGHLKLRPTVATGESTPSKTTEKKPPTLEEKNAQLAGELALAQQKSQMRAIKEDLDSRSDIPKVEIEANEPVPPSSTAPVESARVSPSQPTTAVPVTARTYRSPISSPPLPPTASGSARAIPPQSRFLSTPAPATAQASDPLQQWQLLAGLGSYGSGTKGQTDAATHNEGELLLPDEEATETPETLPQGEKIPSGQRVAGKLESSIVWAEGLRQPTSFVVRLSQPLTDERGQVTVEGGSLMVFEVQEIHSSGLVVASARAVVNNREYPIPSQALQLQGEKGTPLLASLRNDTGGELAGRDFSTFLMGALSQVGELTNRATSTSTFNGIGGTSTSSTYSSPNYLGAILEGGFGNLSEQLEERNQQAIQDLQNRPQLWWVEAGTRVEIAVTRSFSLGETDAQE